MPIFLSHIQSSTTFFSCSIHWLSYSQSSVRVSGMKKSYCIRKKKSERYNWIFGKQNTNHNVYFCDTLSFSCLPNTFLFCSIIFSSFCSINSYQQHPWKHGGVSNQINYFFQAFFSAWLHRTSIPETMSSHTHCLCLNLCPKVFKSHGSSSGECKQQG